MKYLSLIFLAVFSFSILSAQNVKKKYSSLLNEKGSVYFIHPIEGFETADLKKNKSLIFDATFLTYSDSLTFNCTYYNPKASPVDSAFFVNNKQERMSVVSTMLFVEPHKNEWKQRASFKFPKDYFEKLYNEATPYQIEIYSKGKKYMYTMSQGKWKKQAAIVSKIVEIVKNN